MVMNQPINQNIYYFNFYQSIKNSTIFKTINIDEWLEMIKTGDNYIGKINEARAFGKHTDEYDNIKHKSLPVVTPNFLFNNIRKNENIIKSTGIIYLDFDYKTEEEALITKNILKDNEYVYSVFLSLSKLGCGCYIKVNNVTESNFDNIVKEFCNKFALEYDNKAIKKSQCNVLTNDSDIYINKESLTYNHLIEEGSKSVNYSIFKPLSITIPDTFCPTTTTVLFKSKLDNYSEDCVFIPEGKLFVQCFTPFDKNGNRLKIFNGNRNHIMSSFINNLVFLNNYTFEENLIKVAMRVNLDICSEPLSDSDIIKIVKQKINELKKGILKPIKPRLKKYWVNPNCVNKRKAFKDKFSNKSVNEIDIFFADELLNIEHKVTYKNISEFTKLSERTVKRKITEEQIQVLKEFNKKYLSQKQIKRNTL